jgi:hypothetical protein
VVANVRERRTVNKQKLLIFQKERSNLNKLQDAEGEGEYRIGNEYFKFFLSSELSSLSCNFSFYFTDIGF